MNSKWDSCNTHPQWENDGSISSEDEDSLDDSNNDAEKKLWRFIGGGKTEWTQEICITIDEDEAQEIWSKVIKDLNVNMY